MSAPHIKDVVPNLTYSTNYWDDAIDPYDTSDTWDGTASVHAGMSQEVLVEFLSVFVLAFLGVILSLPSLKLS